MYQLIIVVHVLLGLGVIGLVLMQQGKGADAGAAFGSGSSGSVFGAQGASSFLSRTTAILATLFFSTSLGLAVLAGHQGRAKDLMDTPTEIEKKSADVPFATTDAPIVTPTPFSATPSAVDVPVAIEKPEIVDDASKVDDNKVEASKETKSDSADKKSSKSEKNTDKK
jgi:preprotein translocase subunit SecG